jgi:hypothetical protein
MIPFVSEYGGILFWLFCLATTMIFFLDFIGILGHVTTTKTGQLYPMITTDKSDPLFPEF